LAVCTIILRDIVIFEGESFSCQCFRLSIFEGESFLLSVFPFKCFIGNYRKSGLMAILMSG